MIIILLNIKNKTINFIINVLIAINGLLCLIFPHRILQLLPTISGLTIITKGIFTFIIEFKKEGYKLLENIDFEKAIITIAIGIGILFKQQNAIFLIGVFWGLEGLSYSTHLLNELFYRVHNNKKYSLLFIETIIEFILSILLIFEPSNNIEHHIIILGIELLLESFMNIFVKLYKQ